MGFCKTAAWFLAAAGMVLLFVSAETAAVATYMPENLFRWSVVSFVVILPLWLLNIGKIKWNIVDLLSVCLAGLYCISAAVSGNPVSAVALQDMFPFAMIYLCIKVFVSAGGKTIGIFIISLCCLWLCYEAIVGLQQVFGHRASGHSAFGMTGNFENPGPYGGFIAMTMSVAAAYAIKTLKFLPALISKHAISRSIPCFIATAGVVLGILVLPASMSRAAWIAFAVTGTVFIFSETEASDKFRRNKLATASAIAAACVLLCMIFFIKKDSAIGRLHIWNMEARAIAASPLIGSGPGVYPGAYGKAQENYFREKERSETIVEVAGCPEYAFNEYLKAGMEAGITGLVLVISIVIVAIRKLAIFRNPLMYGLVASAVFSFFSYPTSLPQTSFCIVLFLAVAGTVNNRESSTKFKNAIIGGCAIFACATGIFLLKDGYRLRSEAIDSWNAAKSMAGIGLYEDAAAELEPLYPVMSWNYRYLYDYGYSLHKSGEYRKSTDILAEGAEISSDPLFHTIMGKNFEASGQYDKAEQEYLTAHYMVPCRIYPLSLLMDMYAAAGQMEDAIRIGSKILSMPVNPKNKTMVGLQDEVREKMESYWSKQ